MVRGWLSAVVMALGLSSSVANGAEIEVWTRGAEAASGAKVKLTEAKLAQETRELSDPQYGRIYQYRGVPLEALFAAAPSSPTARGVDLALLHFQNGMIIPIGFLDRSEVQRLDAFVAFAYAPPTADGQARWSSQFPPLHKDGAAKRDRRPLRFVGNKMVVKAPPAFNPWRYVDSLVGVEYLRKADYEAPFVRAGPKVKEGFEVFQSQCQFCHGARGHGAQYGWDFVEPVPIYTHRGTKSLELHVRYRELDAAEKGLMMPAFPELEPRKLEALWKWLEALAKVEAKQKPGADGRD